MSLQAFSALVVFQFLLLTIFVMEATSEAPKDDNVTFYILGGKPTIVDEFPFMAALGWINDSGEGGDLKFFGGGVLISPKMVLTAAHVVYINELPDIVFIGGKNLSEVESSNLPMFSVVNVTIFPQYDPTQAYHDIAILELNDTATNSPICLWNRQNLSSNITTAIGYGRTEFAGEELHQLLKVNLTVFPTEFCEPFYQLQRKFKSGISNSHICAGDKDGIKDTCQGDSGGPLIARHNEELFAVGITSIGLACSGFPPAVYTKIHPYTEWIARVLMDKEQSLKTCVH